MTVILASALAIAGVGALCLLVWGRAGIPSLSDVPPLERGDGPRVSIVVAARDEARHIEPAIRALVAQQYHAIELIVVDDRSGDATPAILARLAEADDAIRVVRIDALPEGWLGKNHALHVGAQQATGDALLFVDADVMLAADTLSRAMRLMRASRADHVAIAPDVEAPTAPLALVVNYFFMWFLLYLRPWRARDPRSTAYIGIGAFNLVSTRAYRALDGHARIALRPDDDLMLGKLLKRAGYRQILADGKGAVAVEWYRSLGELARGLRKNAFAGLHYSVVFAIAAALGQFLLGIWPFAAVWIADGPARMLYAIAAAAQMIAYAGTATARHTRPWLTLLYPIAAMLFLGILLAAVTRTLLQRGIEWRGTRYPLDALRANRV